MTFNPNIPKGKLIDFKPIDEQWSLYRLADGNYIRVKIVMTKCIKTDQTNPDGTPIYFFHSQNVVATLTADEVQKIYEQEKETKP